MDHLADRGIPSPKPVRDHGGGFLGTLNGKPAALVRFLAGSDLARPTTDHCAGVGAVLAEIHRAGSTYGTRMENHRTALRLSRNLAVAGCSNTTADGDQDADLKNLKFYAARSGSMGHVG